MKKEKKVLFILICFNLFAWTTLYNLTTSNLLEVNFLDIGQGDSIFIQTPHRYKILIDGGPTGLVLEKLGGLMNFWDKKIDLVILTHPDHDHIGGLIEVLKKYNVDLVLWNGLLKDNGECQEWVGLLSEEADNQLVLAGNKIILSDSYFNVLYPFDLENIKNFNESSITLRFIFEDNSFLFTGDIYSANEKEIIEKGFELQSDVLKVGHHGSKTSSSELFILEVNPNIAIISAGRDNSYGHPHSQVLEILNKYDIKILRTDLSGDIQLISNGEKIKIN